MLCVRYDREPLRTRLVRPWMLPRTYNIIDHKLCGINDRHQK